MSKLAILYALPPMVLVVWSILNRIVWKHRNRDENHETEFWATSMNPLRKGWFVFVAVPLYMILGVALGFLAAAE